MEIKANLQGDRRCEMPAPRDACIQKPAVLTGYLLAKQKERKKWKEIRI